MLAVSWTRLRMPAGSVRAFTHRAPCLPSSLPIAQNQPLTQALLVIAHEVSAPERVRHARKHNGRTGPLAGGHPHPFEVRELGAERGVHGGDDVGVIPNFSEAPLLDVVDAEHIGEAVEPIRIVELAIFMHRFPALQSPEQVWLVHVVLWVAHLDEDDGLRRGRQVVEGAIEEAAIL